VLGITATPFGRFIGDLLNLAEYDLSTPASYPKNGSEQETEPNYDVIAFLSEDIASEALSPIEIGSRRE
jgi:hypothetical protein